MNTGPNLAEAILLAHRRDPKLIKAQLPLAFACYMLGIHLNEAGKAPCPFHHDTDPSFYLWHGDDGIERWSCQPCGLNGDIFDLVRGVTGATFPNALEWAADLLDKLPSDREVSRPERTTWTLVDQRYYGQALKEAIRSPKADGLLAAIAGFASECTSVLLEEALLWEQHLRQWGWTLAYGAAWIPHWDGDGALTGIKTRTPVTQRDPNDGSVYLQSVDKAAIPGSSFGALYGAWRGRRFGDVLLTEGETDCLWADRQAQQQGIQLDCYSLPYGAGSRVLPESIAFLHDARVYTAFDPDPAGHAATARWAGALGDAGIECRICGLPNGVDLRAAAPDLAQMLAAAR